MKRFILFWIKSNRGTNERQVFEIPKGVDKTHIKHKLELWCSGFGAWDHSDNMVTYGSKEIKIPSDKELLKKWETVCKKKRKIDEEHEIVYAMLPNNRRKI